MIMRIKDARTQAGLSQKDVALRMGVAQTCVSQWETETYLPRTRQLPQLANVLGCGIDALFRRDIINANISVANVDA